MLEYLNIPTNQIQSKGSLSASDATEDESKRVLKQIFIMNKKMDSNEIQLNESALLRIGSTFRVSKHAPRCTFM